VDLALDFDAAKSIHVTGNGRYMLRPTVKVIPVMAVGNIDGTISPVVGASVFAISGTDTVASTSPDTTGFFMFSMLTSGSYNVAVHPDTGFFDTTLTGIMVMPQATTHLGTITLTHKP
jgi:hypothetical protein